MTISSALLWFSFAVPVHFCFFIVHKLAVETYRYRAALNHYKAAKKRRISENSETKA